MSAPFLYGPDSRPVSLHAAPVPTTRNQGGLTMRTNTVLQRGFGAILDALPAPDEIIDREGDQIYDKMRADDAVFAAEFQLMTRLLGRKWSIQPPEHAKGDNFATEVAEYCAAAFSRIAVEDMTEHLFRALRHKHAGGQLVYRREGVYLAPDRFYAERRRIFRAGELDYYVNPDGMGASWKAFSERSQAFRWVLHVNEPEPERPGGRSILSRVYWPWKFKREGWASWLTALDRFAVPSIVALLEAVESGTLSTEDVADTVNAQLSEVASGSVGTVIGAKDIKQIGGMSKIEGFDTFVELCERAIYRGILTTTLTVQEGRQGAERGDTSEHDDSADRVAEWYARQLGETMSMQPLAYAALLRFGERARAVLPRFVFDFEGEVEKADILDFMKLGVPTSLTAIYNITRAKPSDEADTFVAKSVSSATDDGGSTGISERGQMAVIRVPVEDRAIVEGRLFTYFRNRQIKDRFSELRGEGATWDEALDVLEEDDRWPLARKTLHNIIASDPLKTATPEK